MRRQSILWRAAKLASPDRRLLIEAAARVTFARLKLLVLPFHSVIRSASRPCPAPVASPGEFPARAAWAVSVTSPRLPVRAKCIEQGLALQSMLRRRGFDARLHYGVAGGEGAALRAHVWVSLAGDIIIGREGHDQYRCLLVTP